MAHEHINFPEWIDPEEPHYLDPELWAMGTALRGWITAVNYGSKDNSSEASYFMARSVGADFSLEAREELAKTMGLLDDSGNCRPGYSLTVDTFNEHMVSSAAALLKPHQKDKPYLIFEFSGIPTNATMLSMMRLEEAFTFPDGESGARKTLLGRLLGKISFKQQK